MDEAFKERVAENQHASAKLEAEIKEVHGKIDAVTAAMSETRVQMKAMDEPIELNRTCAALRKQRMQREDILDPVAAKLRDLGEAAVRAQRELEGHHGGESAHLLRLQERLQRLVEDLRDKTVAANIDRTC